MIKKVERRDKVNFYLDLAETTAKNSTCIHKKCGAVLVNDDTVITTGYTGAPKGRLNCVDIGVCMKDHNGTCRGVHAETNAVIFANRREMSGGTLYVVRLDAKTGEYVTDIDCCSCCKMVLINSGLRDVYIRTSEDTFERQTILNWVDDDDSVDPTALVNLVSN